MDEPTSALDYGNTMRVLSCVRQLAREGLSIVPIDPQPRPRLSLFRCHHGAFPKAPLRRSANPREVITSELISELYGIEVEVNSLYGDKVRVCVPVREIERQ